MIDSQIPDPSDLQVKDLEIINSKTNEVIPIQYFCNKEGEPVYFPDRTLATLFQVNLSTLRGRFNRLTKKYSGYRLLISEKSKTKLSSLHFINWNQQQQQNNLNNQNNQQLNNNNNNNNCNSNNVGGKSPVFTPYSCNGDDSNASSLHGFVALNHLVLVNCALAEWIAHNHERLGTSLKEIEQNLVNARLSYTRHADTIVILQKKYTGMPVNQQQQQGSLTTPPPTPNLTSYHPHPDVSPLIFSQQSSQPSQMQPFSIQQQQNRKFISQSQPYSPLAQQIQQQLGQLSNSNGHHMFPVLPHYYQNSLPQRKLSSPTLGHINIENPSPCSSVTTVSPSSPNNEIDEDYVNKNQSSKKRVVNDYVNHIMFEHDNLGQRKYISCGLASNGVHSANVSSSTNGNLNRSSDSSLPGSPSSSPKRSNHYYQPITKSPSALSLNGSNNNTNNTNTNTNNNNNNKLYFLTSASSNNHIINNFINIVPCCLVERDRTTQRNIDLSHYTSFKSLRLTISNMFDIDDTTFYMQYSDSENKVYDINDSLDDWSDFNIKVRKLLIRSTNNCRNNNINNNQNHHNTNNTNIKNSNSMSLPSLLSLSTAAAEVSTSALSSPSTPFSPSLPSSSSSSSSASSSPNLQSIGNMNLKNILC